jgi:hypothetical protein
VAVLIVLGIGLTFYLRSGKTAEDDSANDQTATASATDESSASQSTEEGSETEGSPTETNNAAASGDQDFSLVARRETVSEDPKLFKFTVSLEAPRLVDDIAQVHYDFVWAKNPRSLDGGAAPSFSAEYEGMGCYKTVIVTVYLKSRGSEPLKRTFNMCKVLTY